MQHAQDDHRGGHEVPRDPGSVRACRNCRHYTGPTTQKGWQWCERLRTYTPESFECQAYQRSGS